MRESGYDGIYLGSQGRIVEVACFAHARRKFFDARSADRARAETALAHIARLYAVEKELRQQGDGEWQGLDRQERFARILAERQARAQLAVSGKRPGRKGRRRSLQPDRLLRPKQRRAVLAYLRDLLTRLLALLPGASRQTLRSLLPDQSSAAHRAN